MEQRDKSMGAVATAPSEASAPDTQESDVVRPARTVADSAQTSAPGAPAKNDKPKGKSATGRKKIRLRETRIEKMMSKAELARRANLSVLTIDRVEKGLGCRMDTKRKILEALGLSLADRVRVFGEEE